jgi:hypothetical protein
MIKSQWTLNTLILFSILFLGPGECPIISNGHTINWSSLTGTLIDEQGNFVDSAMVTSYLGIDGKLGQVQSSGVSLSRGVYIVPNGFPYQKENSNGCASLDQIVMQDFFLEISHPDYQTAIVAFFESNSLNKYTSITIDSVFVAPGSKYGAGNDMRKLPTIKLHHR